MAGEIIIDNKDILAASHEELGYRSGGIGGDELQSRRVLAACHHDHGAFQRARAAKRVDDARNRERIAGAVEVFCRAYAAD